MVEFYLAFFGLLTAAALVDGVPILIKWIARIRRRTYRRSNNGPISVRKWLFRKFRDLFEKYS